MTRRRLIFAILLASSFFATSSYSRINAEAAAPPVGISIISNPRLELSGNPGQTVTGTITVQNTGTSVNDVSTVVNDVLAGDLEGRPKFFPSGQSSSAYPLASWVTVKPEHALLDPSQTLQYDYSIAIPANAAPGGHYGAIGFSVNSNTQASAPVVHAIPRVYALVLLSVSGEAKYSAEITSVSVKHSDKAPSDDKGHNPKPGYIVKTIVKNTGNVHFKPKGAQVVITDTFGKQLLIIPMDANLDKNVLPNSSREFQSSFFRHLGPGIYTAHVSFFLGPDGGSQEKITKTAKFYVGPPLWGWVLILLGVLFLVIVICFRRRLGAAIRAFRNGSGPPKHAPKHAPRHV